MDRPSLTVISSMWREPNCELAYVVRALAGAASRWADVSVVTTRSGVKVADGAFDVRHVGGSDFSHRLDDVSADRTVVVDNVTAEIATLLSDCHPRVVCCIASEVPLEPSWKILPLLPGTGESPAPPLRFYVPVNPDAALHRHNGFGFVGYDLVLSGCGSVHEGLPTEAAWLTSGLHDHDVVVVEEGTAYAWKGRALRGTASVDSRMDLWRLVAHASSCIDLAPGPFIARECVEAMRFGTPIIVPAGSQAATAHVAAGGGSTFADPAELLAATLSYSEEGFRSNASDLARRHADAAHGSPVAFVESLRDVLGIPARH